MDAAEQWEPDDARVSRPVLRERGDATAPRHSPRAQDLRREALVVAGGGSDRHGARRPRATPTRQASGQAAAAQAAEEADATAARDDHRQAGQLWRGQTP